MKKFYYIFLFILVLFLPLIAIPQAQIQHNFNYFPDSLSLNTISIDTLLFTKVRNKNFSTHSFSTNYFYIQQKKFG